MKTRRSLISSLSEETWRGIPWLGRPFTCLLLLCGLSIALPGTAGAEPVKIVSFEIGAGVQTEEGSGLYPVALRHVLGASGEEFSFVIEPLQRAFDTFASKKADCIWAIDATFLAQAGVAQGQLIESQPLFVSALHVFSPPGAPPIGALRELEGKTVGISIGSPVPTVIEDIGADYVLLRTQDIKVRMLRLGRVEFIAAWIPDVLIAFHNAGLAPTAYNPALPVAHSGVGLVCWPTPATERFLHAVSPRIEDFKRSNTLAAILGEFGIALPSTAPGSPK